MLFFQFPDSLPTQRVEDEGTDSKVKAFVCRIDIRYNWTSIVLIIILNAKIKPLSSFSLQSRRKSLKLQDISEGYIGKIQVHKSGKTKYVSELYRNYRVLVLTYCWKLLFCDFKVNFGRCCFGCVNGDSLQLFTGTFELHEDQ